MLFLLLAASCVAQTQVDLRSQSKNVDFSAAPSTRPVKVGTVFPATCVAGELFFNTSSNAGANLYGCTSANTWSVETAGGATGNVAGIGTTVTGTALQPIVNVDSAVVPFLGGSNNFSGLNNMSQQIITKAIPYTTTLADWGLLCDTATAGAPLTMTLPLAPTTGLVQWFKNLGTSTCTIGGNGKFIEGALNLPMTDQGDAYLIQYDGVRWRIITKPAPIPPVSPVPPINGQGAYASLPATCGAGDIYYFTDSLFTLARCSVTDTWSYFYGGKTITPAAAMSLTNGLQSGVTTGNTHGYETLSMPSGGNTTISYRYWTAPAAPYTQYVFLRMPYVPDTNNARCFVAGFQNAASAQNTLKLCTGAAVQSGMWWQVTFGTSGGQTGSDAFGNVSVPPTTPFGDIVIALQDDGTNLHWGVSGDGGDTYTELFTTANTTHFASVPTILFYGGYNSASTFPTKLTFVGVR